MNDSRIITSSQKKSLRFLFSCPSCLQFCVIFFLPLFLLFGCSSNSLDTNFSIQNDSTAAELNSDATYLYWYAEKGGNPFNTQDSVTMNDGSWYKSDYRWRDKALIEIMRIGETSSPLYLCDSLCNSQQRVAYRIHIRFNQEGEAIYQQYRIDNRVLPLTSQQLANYQQQAQQLVTVSKAFNKQKIQLFQGVWNGEHFETCQTQQQLKLTANSALPNALIEQFLAEQTKVEEKSNQEKQHRDQKQEQAIVSDVQPFTQRRYLAFIGIEYSLDIVGIEKVLVVSDFSNNAQNSCVDKPALLTN